MTHNDEGKKRLIVGISRLGDSSGISESGDVMKVTFKAEKSGNTEFSLEDVSLKGVSGPIADVTVNDGTLEIQ